ncbi:MAG: tetratricopeptide repeat protein [Chloroflexi bacterium]|nr:tetratricopeptide repeat protein [Chloroflexota bacterium]
MAKFDVFVGRKEELALLDEWANKWGTMHLIAIQGDGGVGKTWLLLDVLRRYNDRDDFVVAYFDSAEQPFSLQYQVMFLVQHLGHINFPQFLAGMEELTHDYYDLPVLEAQAREKEILQIGIQEINHVLETKRLIFLTDTLEAWGPETGREINEYSRLFSNALMISAGRNVRVQAMPQFEQDFGPEKVSYFELHNFGQVESTEFFDAADKENFISADIRAKLHFLTNGRPVLLSLAVEWLSRDVPLSEIAERSLKELNTLPQDESDDLRHQFEFELVNRVRELKGPLDRAVLYLAHISRRSDARILSVLLDVPRSKAQELLQQLAELSFVRYNPTTSNCTLHDEMKNLVNQHAWPYVDPNGDVRRKLAQKIITDYYKPRIDELALLVRAQLESDRGPVRRTTIGGAEWEQWRLEAECLHYYLQVDAEQGLAYFEDRFEEAQRNNHLMRMQFLLSEIQVAGHTGIRDVLELRRVETLRLGGQVEQASKICHQLLAKDDMSLDNRISAHNILGMIAASTDSEQARQQYESALELAEKETKTRIIGILHNNLGQLYLLTGDLEQSIWHYQQAIEISKQTDNQPLVASARNNLAYVYRRQGDLAQADVLCRVALAQRKRLGVERDLAYSYLTKGEIDRDRGDLESAERYTKLALRSFDKVNAVRGQIMAYRSLANIRRHMEQYEEAGTYLDRGITLAKQIHDEPLLSSLLNVYGRQQRDRAVYLQEIGNDDVAEAILAFYSSAEEYLEQSLELASQYGDQWLITRSQFELALAYFLSTSRPDDYVIQLLEQVWEGASRLGYILLQGYVEENRGEIAQRQQDYATAAKHFGLASQLVGQLRGREPERFFDRLGDRLLDAKLPSETLQTLARGILNVIQKPDDEMDESLQSLQMLCRQVLDLAAM